MSSTEARKAEIAQRFQRAAAQAALAELRAWEVDIEQVAVVSVRAHRRWLPSTIARVVVAGPAGSVEVKVDTDGGTYCSEARISAVGKRAQLSTGEIRSLLG